MTGDARVESHETRLKRLKMRAAHRGTKEMDLILGGFARACLGDMDAAGLDLLEHLMAENDHDIFQWVNGRTPAPAEYSALIRQIARHAGAG